MTHDVFKVCGTCRCWSRAENVNGEIGYCKLNPPTIIVMKDQRHERAWLVEQHLPTMHEDDWCHQWREND